MPSVSDPVLRCQKRVFRDIDVKTIVDVGANYGETVELYRSAWPDASIHAFEPHPQICRKLRERFRDNDNIEISCHALGDVEGVVELKLSSSQSMHSVVGLVKGSSPYLPQGVDYSESVSVPVSKLDDVLAKGKIDHVDILKVDVEGFEKQVLAGGIASLDRQIIRLICIEVMFVEHFESQWTFQDINEYLGSKKYTLFDIPLIKKAGNGRARWGNAIYVNSELDEFLARSHAEDSQRLRI